MTDDARSTSTDAAPQPAAVPVEVAPRRRDGTRTREQLLEAARRRFSTAGYGATTVRDIADDVGVNVALINRYFGSKAGLFEACLTGVVDDLARAGGVGDRHDLPQSLARRLIGSAAASPRYEILPLLLRSSGDPAADELRVGVLRGFSEQIAAVSDAAALGIDDEDLLLRAQLVVAVSIGTGLLRSALPGLQPLASVTDARLADALTVVIDALLGPPAAP